MTDAESTIASIISRRRALGLLGACSVVGLAACADGGSGSDASATKRPSTSTTPSTTSPATTTSPAATDVGVIPEETAGPFPGDGSNGPNALTQSGVVRQDIRSSFAGATGTAAGVPTTLKLRVVDTTKGGAAVPNAAVYLWHCDREGRYSMYSQGATDANYLRGVQPTDADGVATFTSIFPACYSGRWPHVHFEVYPDIATATAAGTKLATSQIALPKDTCETVYAADGYSASVGNLTQVSLTSDMVFSDDGGVHELPTVTGNVSDGYVVELTAGVEPATV
jgi:protocatechuate 3,4-dioxygenase beta subunit